MTRSLVVVAMTAALVLAPIHVASAQTLSDHLEEGARAEFRGSQAVRCTTPDGPRQAIVDLVQTGGVLSTSGAPGSGGSATAVAGALAVVRPDGSSSSTAVPVSERLAAAGYTISRSERTTLIGREVTRLSVSDRADVERVLLSFDRGTGALLASRVLQRDGSVYCETQMISFEGEVGAGATAPDASQPLPSISGHDRLPDRVAGFERLDGYRWDEDGVIGYYSDGLFSYSLLATTRSVELAAEEVTTVEAGDGVYARWYGPGQVVVVWDEPAGGLAISGDLPPDMLAEVLDELPEPHEPGLLSRVWRNLFG